MVEYSVFAPVYNEEANIAPFYEAVRDVMDKIGKPWELILVNDGSTDNSLQEMRKLKGVVIVDLQRNYGQSVAMDAGFRQAKGNIIITLDADLQNDPKDIPKLLKKLYDDDLDVVAGWRQKRKDPLWMRVVTKCARLLRRAFISDGVKDSGCTLRVYRREMVHDLELWGEMHRYIIALLRWRGARIGQLQVKHHARTAGVSKYNALKSLRGFVDLFYIWFWKKFSARPLHLFGVFGILLMSFGVLAGFWTMYLKFFNNVSLSDSVWFAMSGFTFLIGLQFFVSGIMLDLLIRNYHNTSLEKRYVIRAVEGSVPNKKKVIFANK